jgi:glycosyltransferase involved in cell wall biosynthesis
MRILIATDAGRPQVNGVVRTLGRVTAELRKAGHRVRLVEPRLFRTLPCPSYPEIRLALIPYRRCRRLIEEFAPDAIHIATEGPIGQAARRYCLKRGLAFTTAYHTRFPEYIRARTGLPLALGYWPVRRFHAASAGVMVATETIERELVRRGFRNIRRWSRGVDTDLFRPRPEPFLDLPRPIHLYVGRLAIEKNLDAFLGLALPGSKLVVGDGPARGPLERRHPDAVFVGAKTGETLARHYAAADLFVFPSRTDTFGLVLLEALASGLPVAAFPVPGPLDVIDGCRCGVLDEDLARAIEAARGIPPERCRAHALEFSWPRSAEQFRSNLVPV